MEDVLGTALFDFFKGNHTEDISTLSTFGEDILPLPHLFRDYGTMPFIEQNALQICRGRVLDIGCGAGPHSLYLQDHGFDVTAIDISEKAIEVCKLRGIKRTAHSHILDYSRAKFDTLLLLMNGIGIAGTLGQLPTYLNHFKTLLHSKGQILLDSTDVIYMYHDDDENVNSKKDWSKTTEVYYGETQFKMTYKELESNIFDWLYVDYDTLANAAKKTGLKCELVSLGDHYDYLARLFL